MHADKAGPPTFETYILRVCNSVWYDPESLDAPYSPVEEHRWDNDDYDKISCLMEIREIPGAMEWIRSPSRYNRRVGVMVLRHLSKNVYVRSCSFSAGGGHNGFGQALVFRIT